MSGALGTASTRNIAGSSLGNFSFAIQDIITVLQFGGSFERAMLAAGNNFGFIATAAGGATGAILGVVATLGVGIFGSFIGDLITAGDETEGLEEKLKNLEDRIRSLKDLESLRLDIDLGLEDADRLEDIFGREIPFENRLGRIEQFAQAQVDAIRDANRELELAQKERDVIGRRIAQEQGNLREALLERLIPETLFGKLFVPNVFLKGLRQRGFLQRIAGVEGQSGNFILPNRAFGTPEQLERFIRESPIDEFRDLIPEKLLKDLDALNQEFAESEDAINDQAQALQLLKAEAREQAIERAKELQAEERRRQAIEENRRIEREFIEFEERRRRREFQQKQRDQQRQAEREARDQDRARERQERARLSASERILRRLLPGDQFAELQIDRLIAQAFPEGQVPEGLRGSLLAQESETGLSGTFGPANFVSQITNALLRDTENVTNLSPEVERAILEIERHLRDAEGIGVE